MNLHLYAGAGATTEGRRLWVRPSAIAAVVEQMPAAVARGLDAPTSIVLTGSNSKAPLGVAESYDEVVAAIDFVKVLESRLAEQEDGLLLLQEAWSLLSKPAGESKRNELRDRIFAYLADKGE